MSNGRVDITASDDDPADAELAEIDVRDDEGVTLHVPSGLDPSAKRLMVARAQGFLDRYTREVDKAVDRAVYERSSLLDTDTELHLDECVRDAYRAAISKLADESVRAKNWDAELEATNDCKIQATLDEAASPLEQSNGVEDPGARSTKLLRRLLRRVAAGVTDVEPS